MHFKNQFWWKPVQAKSEWRKIWMEKNLFRQNNNWFEIWIDKYLCRQNQNWFEIWMEKNLCWCNLSQVKFITLINRLLLNFILDENLCGRKKTVQAKSLYNLTIAACSRSNKRLRNISDWKKKLKSGKIKNHEKD